LSRIHLRKQHAYVNRALELFISLRTYDMRKTLSRLCDEIIARTEMKWLINVKKCCTMLIKINTKYVIGE